ncbi:protein phosphatase 1L-like [Lethenteron reissneri]|uniref:protein phosphatase 1L-like n=1 Tax=Lethenteron reissneri TaxID=7753 RepID=UPI002AB6DF3C|nr:protein phosphatase 1L-like [Lethenteron reissneri]
MGLCSLCGRAVRFILLRPASLLLACLCLAFWSYLGSPGTRVRTLVSAGSGTAGRGAARFLGGGELPGARAGAGGAAAADGGGGDISDAADDMEGPGGYMAQAGRPGMMPGGGPEFVEVAKWNSKAASAFALRGLGRRAAAAGGGDRGPSDPKMRALEDWDNRTHPGIFCIFDTHGGEFAADFSLKRLTQGLRRRLLEERVGTAPPAAPRAPPRAPPPPPSSTSSSLSSLSSAPAAPAAAAPSNGGGTSPAAALAAGGTSARAPGGDGDRRRRRGAKARAVGRPARELAASRVRELALEEVLATETELLAHQAASQDESGTSLLLAVVGERGLTVLSVGDSQAVLCDRDGPARPLTRPHKPYLQAERRRIKRAGGYISFSDRAWRVQGVLTASRSLGDPGLKASRVVIAEPDVVTRETNPDPVESATGVSAGGADAGGDGGARAAGSPGLLGEPGGFLLLGSNELWSGVSPDEACALVSERLLDPGMGARELALRAFHRRGGPDAPIAVMVVKPPLGAH